MTDTVIKIEAYNEFQAGMAKLKDEGNFLPDMSTKETRKVSKDYALKSRKVEIKIDKIRSAEKKYWIEGGKQVDIQAKTLIGEISESRLPHHEAVKAFEDAEKLQKQKRQDEATAKIETIAIMIETAEYLDSTGVAELMEQCENFDTENGLWELTNDGIACKLRVGKKLLEMYLSKQQKEADDKELAELRAKQAIQDQKDHDARIAQQASEQAEKDKQEAIEREEQAKRDQLKAEQDKIKTEKRLKELDKQYKIDAENARIEAEEQARQAAEDARLAEVARKEAEEEQERERIAELEANKAHVSAVRKATKESLMLECGLDEETAKKVTLALSKKLIENAFLQY